MNELQAIGWTSAHQIEWDALSLSDLQPARVVADFGTSLKIALPQIRTAELTGKLAHYTARDLTPKVGDWVAARTMSDGTAIIEAVVCRRNEIARKIAGKQMTKQIIAVNVDIAFVLLALDNDFSIERLQRFIYQLSIDKIEPVIVLNKADKTDDLSSYTKQLTSFNLPIVITTAVNGIGIDAVMNSILPGRTAILLGSSGVGKSTLTNKLLQREAQATGAVRDSDSTGMHTTVHRELFVLPNGGLLIDTPGIRELSLWGIEDNLEAVYKDILETAKHCKYNDCHHDKETGCAIRKALQNGKIDKNHYANYLKMKKELSKLATNNTVHHKKSNQRPMKSTEWEEKEDY